MASIVEERRKNQRFAAYEIIDTEKTFLYRLQCVSDVFISGIKEQNILDAPDIDLQFGCWNTLLQLSKNFYDKLQTMRNSNDPELGQIMKEFIEDPAFSVYKDYLLKFEPALNRRAVLSTTNKRYASFVAAGRNDPRCMGFGLEPLLTEPVARIPRYKLLLEQLIKYTEKGSVEFDLLNQNLRRISEIASANNEAIRGSKNQLKLMEVMMSIDIRSRINLLDDPHRWFIRSGALQRQCRHGSKEFMFWLFNDQLLYGEASTVSSMSASTVYSLNRALPLSECFVGADVVGLMDRRELAFSIKSPLKSFVIWCKSVEEKNLWVSDLQKAITGMMDPKQPRLAWGLAPILLPETSIVSCPDCSVTFNFVINKKYHCRHCGQIKCIGCANQQFFLHHVDPSRPVRVCGPCFQDLSGGRRFTFDALASAGFSMRTILKARGRVLDKIDPLRHSVSTHSKPFESLPPPPPSQVTSSFTLSYNGQGSGNASSEACIESRTKRSVSFAGPNEDLGRQSMIGADMLGRQSIVTDNRQNCKLCFEAFSLFRAKATCMNCGFNICKDCSPNKFLIPSIDVKNEVRVCLACYDSLSAACLDYRPSEALVMTTTDSTTRSSLFLGPGMIGRSSEGFVGAASSGGISNGVTANSGGSMNKRRVGAVAASATAAAVVKQCCKVCLQEFNSIKNIRCECDNCGVSACVSCLASAALIVPYLSLEKACRVCRHCRVLVTSSFSPFIIATHMSALADASNGRCLAGDLTGIVSEEARQSIYFLQSVTADELREMLSPRSECSNLSSRESTPREPLSPSLITAGADREFYDNERGGNSRKQASVSTTSVSFKANGGKSSSGKGTLSSKEKSGSTSFLRSLLTFSSKSTRVSSTSTKSMKASEKVAGETNENDGISNTRSNKVAQLEMDALLNSEGWVEHSDEDNDDDDDDDDKNGGIDEESDVKCSGRSYESFEEDWELLEQVQRAALNQPVNDITKI